MAKAMEGAHKISKQEEEDMQTAALILGVGRVDKAIKTQRL